MEYSKIRREESIFLDFLQTGDIINSFTKSKSTFICRMMVRKFLSSSNTADRLGPGPQVFSSSFLLMNGLVKASKYESGTRLGTDNTVF